jgi:predicted DNA-binding transcriptional regulator YafY
MIQLLTALQSRESYSAYNLAEMLNISKRMLFRDLNELKKIGVPYNYDKKSRGYKIDPSFFFSTPTLETQEALGLLLFIHKLRNNIRIPFGNSAFKAALKIESKLPEKLKRFCQNALDKILTTGRWSRIIGQWALLRVGFWLLRENSKTLVPLVIMILKH